MRDRLIALEPFIGFGDGLALGVAEGVAVFLGGDHGLQQMNHGGELVRPELVRQVMGVLSVSGHGVLPLFLL
jgi:hypothetical protein